MSPTVALLSAVAMSKVTPPGPAGALSMTLKVRMVVPASPSVATVWNFHNCLPVAAS